MIFLWILDYVILILESVSLYEIRRQRIMTYIRYSSFGYRYSHHVFLSRFTKSYLVILIVNIQINLILGIVKELIFNLIWLLCWNEYFQCDAWSFSISRSSYARCNKIVSSCSREDSHLNRLDDVLVVMVMSITLLLNLFIIGVSLYEMIISLFFVSYAVDLIVLSWEILIRSWFGHAMIENVAISASFSIIKRFSSIRHWSSDHFEEDATEDDTTWKRFQFLRLRHDDTYDLSFLAFVQIFSASLGKVLISSDPIL